MVKFEKSERVVDATFRRRVLLHHGSWNAVEEVVGALLFQGLVNERQGAIMARTALEF